MIKSSPKSSPKTTSTKASKKAESAAAFAAALKEQAKEAAPKANGKAPAIKAAPVTVEAPKTEEKATKPKHEAIKSGGTIQINEAVGVHFRADAETAPAEGDMVMVQVGKAEVPLIVSCTKPLVDGSTLIQAFVTKKSGDYKILGEAKGETATVIWK